MKRYDKYKPSGIEWIGSIPEHWKVKKIKRFSLVKRGASPRPINNQKYFDKNGEFSWVRIADVSVSKRYLKNTTQTLSELGASLSVKIYPNEIFLSIAGTVGKPIISRIKCCIHDGFVYFPYLKINPEYWFYIFLTGAPYIGLGKLGTQLNLNTDSVGNIYMPLPNNDEINNIINFLDKETSKIDEVIKDKEQLIKLLEEEKEIIISDSITKGLNPDVEMKDSGVEWIGNIPKSWEVKKIKFLSNIYTGRTPSSSKGDYFINGKVNWFTPSDINSNIFLNSSKRKLINKAVEDNEVSMYSKGSTVIVGIGSTIGKTAYLNTPASCNQQLHIITFNQDIIDIFGFYLILVLGKEIKSFANFVTLPIINQYDIKNLFITFPTKDEQQKIVDYLNKETSKIDKTISTIKDEIKLIKEYKEILIYEVVTGKIDVREEKVS